MQVSAVLTTQSPNGTLTYLAFPLQNGWPHGGGVKGKMMTILAYLVCDGLHNAGQVMVLPLARLHPRREVAQLAIVPVVREPHLWADEQYLAIVHDHAAVVYHVLVHHRPAHLAHV